MRGRKTYSGKAARRLASSAAGQVADPDRAGVEFGGDDVVHQPLHLGQVRSLLQWQMQCDALEAVPPGLLEDPSRCPQGARVHAVAQHRGGAFEYEARSRLGVEQVGDVDDTADRVNQSGIGLLIFRRPERTPRREHQQVLVEARLDGRDLVVRPHGQRVDAEPLGFACEPGQAEAVAVALDDRHQCGFGVGQRAQVRTPAVTVHVQRQAHRRAM